jgi:hypothetical protein
MFLTFQVFPVLLINLLAPRGPRFFLFLLLRTTSMESLA